MLNDRLAMRPSVSLQDAKNGHLMASPSE